MFSARADLEFDLVAVIDPDTFRFRIGVERGRAELAADTALGVASEGHRMTDDAIVIDPDRAGADAMQHAMSAPQVLGPDPGGKAITRIVRNPHRVVFVLEANDRGDGAEYLLACDPAVGRYVSVDGGRHEVPLSLQPLATRDAVEAFALGNREIGQYLLQLRTGCEGSELGRRVKRITRDHPARALCQKFADTVVDRSLHQYPGPRDASLTRRGKNPRHHPVHSVIELGIRKDHVG